MKINNLAKTMFVVLLLGITCPSMAASTPGNSIYSTSGTRATELQNRLEEIDALDKTELSRAEKKVLRKEVKEIKKELATMAGGVYLSIGAIILIALLLILLL
jgi:hypothetical protein